MTTIQTIQIGTMIRLCCYSVGIDIADDAVLRDPVAALMLLQRKLAVIDADRSRLLGEHADRMAGIARSLAVALDMEIDPEDMTSADACESVLMGLVDEARGIRQAWNTLITDEIVGVAKTRAASSVPLRPPRRR